MEESVESQGQTSGRQVGLVKVGSRKSQLALIQTDLVVKKLEQFYLNNPDRWAALYPACKVAPELNFKIVAMSTTGDKILNKPLPEIGTKSLFTRELEVELLENRVDIVVHSLKDLPTTLPQGCSIGAILEIYSPEDAIVLKKSLRESLNPVEYLLGRHQPVDCSKTKVGTSSHRRIAMVKRCNKNIQCADIRGNLNTRLTKLDNDEGDYAAIILAKAGLDRMGWSDRISSVLAPNMHDGLHDWLYAVGQGALAVECRSNDQFVIDFLSPLVDIKSTCEVVAERNLMKKLEAGCSVPLGVRSTWASNSLRLESVIISIDGTKLVRACSETQLRNKTATDLHVNANDLSSRTTGIVFSDKLLSSSGIQEDLIDCHKLGLDVANKMISLGALELMSCKLKQ